MAKQRTLQDLYVKGKEVTLGEGEESVTVWAQKLNPVEHAQAMRRADAARARILACKFDHDSDDYQALLDDVLTSETALLVDVLALTEEARISAAREAKVADEEEWKNDNLLQGLRDSWADELYERYIDDPTDEEAKKVFEALERFTAQVRQVVDDEMASFRSSLEAMSEKELVETSVQHRLKTAGDMAWINEYHRSEVSLGTRSESNHREKVFTHRGEVDELQGETFFTLATAFRELTVDPSQGKDSAAAPPSSPSSDPSAPEATEPPSGPMTAAA